MAPQITPVILAGGKGTRLWPLVNADRPKPFLRPFSRHSLLQETLLRARDFASPVLITEEHNLARARQDVEDIGVMPAFVLEPEGRGTAAALMLAAMTLRDKPGLMLVMPSDHVIVDPQHIFPAFVTKAASYVGNGIVQIGVPPHSPQTRYGYIEVVRDGTSPYVVTGFIEKPPADKACALIRSGNCFWNTGMFLTSPTCFLSLCAEVRPLLYHAVRSAFEAGAQKKEIFTPDPVLYGAIENISIDHAVLPHCKHLRCCPLPLPWYDTGCWSMFLYLKLRRFMKGHL
ncbi:MAG: NTP transferase domain-containing protein [Alphaproteobacteria bacterium]|nr:NTP transferase domain-containing protein [Alphaproteobacteria bacterium]